LTEPRAIREQIRDVVLFDGNCRFCTAQAKRITRRFPRALVAENFQEADVLAKYEDRGVTYEECMKQMQLVARTGRVYGGAEAVARILIRGVPVIGLVAYFYYVPGIRQLANALYRMIARYRYRIAAKKEPCTDGTCKLHVD
jgi:predicted DCC family thiol-disulfide oxidoreductase YuxK